MTISAAEAIAALRLAPSALTATRSRDLARLAVAGDETRRTRTSQSPASLRREEAIHAMETSGKARILVVDDEPNIRTLLRVCLEGAGYDVALAPSGEAAVAAARRSPPDLAFVDLRLGQMDGLALTRALAHEAPTAAVVLITAYATIDNAVDAMRAGAVDFLPKPFTPAQVLHTVDKVLGQVRMQQELTELKRAGSRGVHALAFVLRAARTDATVLLLGETGTGKGYLARHVHVNSPRRDRAFITVNCAVLAPSLIESELFGHAKGAFTGADRARAGHVEAAGGGTLFLDEVGDLPREAQGKLLRLLEEHEYVRVGETEPRRSEARIIAATHRDLRAAAAAGSFREDLFYRLNVVTATLPPLRDRREDLTGLAEGSTGAGPSCSPRPPWRRWRPTRGRAINASW
jgi:NtrC-family two-component system response regulator AlgB